MSKMPSNQEETKVLIHHPVLLEEICEQLELRKKRNVVDATLGFGGHASVMLQHMPKNGKLIGFDADSEHLKEAKKKLRKFKDRTILVHSNFVHMTDELQKTKVRAIDAFLFDLGIASPHVDNPARGFSFMQDGPLDMRFNIKQELTAADVINEYPEKELVRIFEEYGEERWAKKIAREIVRSRRNKSFKTTKQLADFVEKLVFRPKPVKKKPGKKGGKKAKRGRIHPATRVFQAVRIEVNRELDVLSEALQQAVELLKPKGRIAVISYHSLEDRIVKHFFRGLAHDNERKAVLRLVTKKPIVPTDAEILANPRSRSAKLRIVEKL